MRVGDEALATHGGHDGSELHQALVVRRAEVDHSGCDDSPDARRQARQDDIAGTAGKRALVGATETAIVLVCPETALRAEQRLRQQIVRGHRNFYGVALVAGTGRHLKLSGAALRRAVVHLCDRLRDFVAQHDVEDAADRIHAVPDRRRVEQYFDSLYCAQRDGVEVEGVDDEALSAREGAATVEQHQRRVGAEAAQLSVLSAAAAETVGPQVRLLRQILQEIGDRHEAGPLDRFAVQDYERSSGLTQGFNSPALGVDPIQDPVLVSVVAPRLRLLRPSHWHLDLRRQRLRRRRLANDGNLPGIGPGERQVRRPQQLGERLFDRVLALQRADDDLLFGVRVRAVAVVDVGLRVELFERARERLRLETQRIFLAGALLGAGSLGAGGLGQSQRKAGKHAGKDCPCHVSLPPAHSRVRAHGLYVRSLRDCRRLQQTQPSRKAAET